MVSFVWKCRKTSLRSVREYPVKVGHFFFFGTNRDVSIATLRCFFSRAHLWQGFYILDLDLPPLFSIYFLLLVWYHFSWMFMCVNNAKVTLWLLFPEFDKFLDDRAKESDQPSHTTCGTLPSPARLLPQATKQQDSSHDQLFSL